MWENKENVPSHIIDEFTSQISVSIEVSMSKMDKLVAHLKLAKM